MSDSTIKSNLVGKAGTETITNFATIGDTSTKIESQYVKLGANKYIFSDDTVTAATVLANAVAIDSAVKSSIVLGLNKMWYIATAGTINAINATALT